MRASLQSRLFGRGEPVRIGRFVVVDRLGEGGMGTVFRAYDPDLDRRIAIKVLRSDLAGSVRDHERLAREAKLLARLNHPNVVAVHEVGTVDEGVFLAMEYVEGQDLGAWARATPPGSRERLTRALDLLLQAGRGLAGAHATGLVHRDVKPSNILVGKDGRVRVADFGLARRDSTFERTPSSSGTTAEKGRSDGDSARSSTDDEDASRTQGIVGTLAYMAPEQRRGEPVNALADQYAWCVTAWEVLVGARPELESGRPPPDPPGTTMPRHVRVCLHRGLSRDPADRFESMDALLAAFAHDPARARRRWLAGAVVAGSAVAATVAYQTHRASLCDEVGAPIAETWTATRRDAVERAFAATSLPFSDSTWRQVEAAFDEYVGAWSQASVEVCETTRVDGLQPPDVLASANRCLETRRAELDALIEVFTRADAATVRSAVGAASALAPIDTCTDPQRVRDTIPLPEDDAKAEEVMRARAELGRLRMWRAAGQHRPAAEGLEALVPSARALAYPPVLAEVLLSLGMARETLGDGPGATAALEEAYWLALEHRHDVIAAKAARALVDHLAAAAELDAAVRWSKAAEVVARRATADPTMAANLARTIARLRMMQGDLAAAEASLRHAIEIAPTPLQRSTHSNNLALVLAAQDRFSDAMPILVEAIEIEERELGPDHVDLAPHLVNLANLRIDLGETDEAIAPAERALALRRATFGPRHPDVASSLQTLGRIAYTRRDFSTARTYFEEALDIVRETRGPGDPLVTRIESSLAASLVDLGELEDALALHRGVLEARSDTLGVDHPETGKAWRHVGWVLLELGRTAEALAALRRADDVLTETLGPDHGFVLDLQALLGRALADAGERDRARATLEVAIGRAARSENAGPELDLLRATLEALP
jgi:eukaryotic-like serine/threonine-protein kinase